MPVLLVARALVDISDAEFFARVAGTRAGSRAADDGPVDTFTPARLEILLADSRRRGIHTAAAARAFLGGLFRGSMQFIVSSNDSDTQVSERSQRLNQWL